MVGFDWVAHRKHRDQVIADHGQWVGLFDEQGEPLMDMPPIVDMNAPEVRSEPGSLSMSVLVRSRSDVLHPIVSELVADGLDIDDNGVFIERVNQTRMVVVERPGNGPDSRRAYTVIAPETTIAGSLPSVLTMDGVDVLTKLKGLPCMSIPETWTGQWIDADRDWAGPWEQTREIQDAKFASVADGFTDSGPAEATIRQVITRSLQTLAVAEGMSQFPIVVDQTPTGYPSPDVVIRRTDDYIWSTVAAHAAAAGVRITAHLWLPGDDWGPSGLTLPTIVVYVRQSVALGDEVDIPPLVADGATIVTPRRTANRVYGSWRVTAPSGIEQIAPAEDRTDGYLYRPPNAPAGRFDFEYVRQDASIELDAITNAGETSGRSDVELQMEAGQKRSEGRVLLQNDIPLRGLGRTIPGLDFVVGDIVPVLIGGKRARLVVSAIDWLTNTEGEVVYGVRLGGQLIQDIEQLRSLNSDAMQQIDAERRRREEEAKRLESQAATDRQQTQQIGQVASQANTTANAVQTITTKQTGQLDVTYEMLLGLRNFAQEVYDWRRGDLTDVQFRAYMQERVTYFTNIINGWES